MLKKIIILNKNSETVYYNEGSILKTLEENNIFPRHSCRNGICEECESEILEGEVISENKPVSNKENSFLLCCSIPKSNIIKIKIQE